MRTPGGIKARVTVEACAGGSFGLVRTSSAITVNKNGCPLCEIEVMSLKGRTSRSSPVCSEMLKKGVNGLPSGTSPYLMSRGFPRSPSSACTRSTGSPGNKAGLRVVVGGARVKTGGVSCTSITATRKGHDAIFRVSSDEIVHGSYEQSSHLEYYHQTAP